MKSIALRFSDNFAPSEGTIKLHQYMIDKNGFVWYGKFGPPIATQVANSILKQEKPKILLIHSGGTERYWGYIEKITRETPEKENIPSYYRNKTDKINTWFKLIKIEKALNDVMSKCFVISSRSTLSNASKYSMSPYFKIEYNE